jgi:hypothetical protein
MTDSLNVLNIKALEKQLKVLETRIAEVQRELEDLEKKRRACLILMGQDVELEPRPAASAESGARPSKPAAKPKPKPDTALFPKVSEVLAEAKGPLSMEQICKLLAIAGQVKDASKARATVEALLEEHPETFIQNEEGGWSLRQAGETNPDEDEEATTNA